MKQTDTHIIEATFRRWGFLLPAVAFMLFHFCPMYGQESFQAIYDIDAARELCDELPLDNVEGIWLYPDDNLTVLLRRLPEKAFATLPEYSVMVVRTPDCRIAPGEIIGSLKGSAEDSKFILTLNTEKRRGFFSKPHECMATLSKNGDSMILSRDKSKFRLRINLNPNSLLPKLWKSLLRFGVSVGSGNDAKRPSPGMIKLYPSYDGNGSSRLRPRYL